MIINIFFFHFCNNSWLKSTLHPSDTQKSLQKVSDKSCSVLALTLHAFLEFYDFTFTFSSYTNWNWEGADKNDIKTAWEFLLDDVWGKMESLGVHLICVYSVSDSNCEKSLVRYEYFLQLFWVKPKSHQKCASMLVDWLPFIKFKARWWVTSYYEFFHNFTRQASKQNCYYLTHYVE